MHPGDIKHLIRYRRDTHTHTLTGSERERVGFRESELHCERRRRLQSRYTVFSTDHYLNSSIQLFSSR